MFPTLFYIFRFFEVRLYVCVKKMEVLKFSLPLALSLACFRCLPQVELRKVKVDEKLKRLRNVGQDNGGDSTVSGPDVQLDVSNVFS
jgi:hypothetical protein